MKTLKLFAIALLGCFAVACTEELVESVQMKSSEMTFGAEGDATTLTFSANAQWNVTTEAEWITFDATTGTAGEANVKMTVAANEEYDAREADVTIAVGNSQNLIKVKQEGVSEFTAKIPYKLDAAAQSITFEIKSNVEYSYKIAENAKDWITVPAEVKSAPVESKLTFDIAANTDLIARNGNIFIAAGDASYCLLVKQYGVATEMLSATAAYMGNAMDIYNNGYTDIKEYYVSLKGEKKDVTLALNIDPASTEDPFAGLPVGTFSVDAGASHAKETFSIKQNDEKYYTAIFENGEEIDVVDGEINIVKEKEGYTINAILVDKTGKLNNFLYVGNIATIEDKTLDANVYDASFKGQYDTYFASKSNAWLLSLHASRALNAEDPYYSYLSTELYGPAGEVNTEEFPTGTFTYAKPEPIADTKYKNGILDAKVGTFVMFGNDIDNNDCEVIGGTIKISKDEKGLYTVDYDLKVKQIIEAEGSRTEKEFNYKVTYDKLVIDVKKGYFQTPAPDVDHEFKAAMGNVYSGLWLGSNLFGVEGTNTFVVGYQSVDNGIYNIQFCLNISGEWKYEKNFVGRFCNTPLPNAVCEFSKTPKANAVYPIMLLTNKYTWIKNGYTGTNLEPCGGTVEVTATGIKIDIDATDGTTTLHFNGTIPSTLQYLQDKSKSVANYKLPEVK